MVARAVMLVGAFAPAAVPFVMFGMLALAVAGTVYSGYQRWDAGQSVGQSIVGGLTDAVGLTGMYAGMYGEDIITGANLGMTNAQRGSAFGGGLLQLAGTLIGARKFDCFAPDTKVEMDEENNEHFVFAEAPSETDEAFAQIDWSAIVVAGTFIVAAGQAYTQIKRRRKSSTETFRDDVDTIFSDENFGFCNSRDDEELVSIVA